MGAVRDLVSADKFRDECGVVGIYGHPDAANLAYLSLYAMQHRGQESAGIVAWNGTRMLVEKGMGYVAEVFDQTRLARLPGRLAIGHVRYSTTGMSLLENAQPIVYNTNKGPLGIAHNGNLVNAGEIRRGTGAGRLHLHDLLRHRGLPPPDGPIEGGGRRGRAAHRRV